MKRSERLARRTPLHADPDKVRAFQQRGRSAAGTRRRKLTVDRTNPERIAWKVATGGFCDCGCGRFSIRLARHHVVYEQHVRAEGGNVWDIGNSMLLHADCHRRHHAAVRRLPVECLPESALAFAIALLGVDAAAVYLARYYGCERTA